MNLTRRSALVVVLGGLWPLLVWPNFLRVVWKDDRSWDDGPTAFFLVHAVLAVVSLAIGAAVLRVGVRALRARP